MPIRFATICAAIIVMTGMTATAQTKTTVKYNFPEGKYVWAAGIEPADHPLSLPDQGDCSFVLATLNPGAEVTALCKVRFLMYVGVVYWTLRRGELREAPDGHSWLEVRWETWVVTSSSQPAR